MGVLHEENLILPREVECATMNDRGNPFKIGDKAVFDPDARTIGWTYSSFDRLRIHPGDVGIVTKIVDDMILIDDDRGGFAWECFKKAE